MDFYSSISRYYDYIFPYSPEQKKFIDAVAGPVQGLVMLDIGCGTGALPSELAKSGHKAYAIDFDREMVFLANQRKIRDKLGDYPIYKQMDMKLVDKNFKPDYFDIVSCFGNTLVHLGSSDEISRFIKSVALIQKKESDLLIQILNYDYIIESRIDTLPKLENDTIIFERWYEFTDDGLVDFITRLTVKKESAVVSNRIRLFPLRKGELDSVLVENGFDIIGHYGSFSMDPLGAKSLPLLVHAKKR